MPHTLKEFITSIESFDSFLSSDKLLVFSYFLTEVLGSNKVTTKDLSRLYKESNILTPQNFGGEIRVLKAQRKIYPVEGGYKLTVGAKRWVNQLNKVVKPFVKNKSFSYINESRLEELNNIESSEYDFKRLVKLCKEIQSNFKNENYLSLVLALRAILDHIPPIFTYKTFREVANNYGSHSFKESMDHLENSSRKIADHYLHSLIRKKETLPNNTQIDFSNDLDVLLSEIIRIS